MRGDTLSSSRGAATISRAGLSCCVALGALWAGSGGAQADDFIVRSGETANFQQMSDPGDVGIIESGGTIRTFNNFNSPVRMFNTDQALINYGLIATEGDSVIGILSVEANAQIHNAGVITIAGFLGSSAIGALGPNAQIYNSGRISSASLGILSVGPDALIYNSGDIATVHSYGIQASGTNATITNSGKIASEQWFAIIFEGSSATLNLLAGTAIHGGIQFVAADATLNVGPGLNTALTFTGLPASINTLGAPILVHDALVAVVDPTGFSAEDEMLTDLTRAIAGAVDGRLNAARFGYVPMASSVTAYAEADTQPTTFGYASGSSAGPSGGNSGFWAAGLGSWRNQDPDGPNVGFDTALGGLLVGYDAEVTGGTRVGGFLGASTSRFETDADSQEIDADSYYGGVYAGFTGQTYFLDLSLTGGVSQQSSDRTVANNLVEGGIEHADADYDGVFVSPSATIGTTYAMSGGTLIPTLRARYAGLFLDDYDESGSVANLSVDGRDVNVFDFRAQLAYALAAKPLDSGSFHAVFRFGADATFADNENVEAVLLGDALNFSVSGDDTLRGFAGVDVAYRTDGGSSYFFGAEAGYDSDAVTLDVKGGLQIPL